MNVGPSITHGDPVAPVILGVTSILAFAVIGRVAARKLGQPTVLGELLMGILLGNIAWYLGVDLITVLREGPQVFDVVNQALAARRSMRSPRPRSVLRKAPRSRVSLPDRRAAR